MSKPPSGPEELPQVVRAVIRNQLLFTAGNALTTGGFLTYFGYELGATAFLISLVLVVPETVGAVGLFARPIIHSLGRRKNIYVAFSVAARLVSLGIPLLAFSWFRFPGVEPLWVMVGCLAVSQAAQAIAYVAYVSWLSDLVPEHRWGMFFAKRDIAKLSILLVVPVAGGYLRDWWRRGVPEEIALLAYVATFCVGVGLLFVAIIPLMRLPDVAVRWKTESQSDWRRFTDALRDRPFRWLIVYSWWLAAAQGLTQSAFFFFQRERLGISLGTYYVLSTVMLLLQIPLSWFTGFLCDRFGSKTPLLWGSLLVTFAMPFWFLATPQQWAWVFGAYVFWGGFAAVNVAGRNLALKLAPRSDNATHLALFRQISGLLAGLTGLLGGLWLDELLESQYSLNFGGYRLDGYALIFLVSWIGRLTAVLWVIPIREPGAKSLGWIVAALRRGRKHRLHRRQVHDYGDSSSD